VKTVMKSKTRATATRKMTKPKESSIFRTIPSAMFGNVFADIDGFFDPFKKFPSI